MIATTPLNLYLPSIAIHFYRLLLSNNADFRLGVPNEATPAGVHFRAGMKATPSGASNTVTDPMPSK